MLKPYILKPTCKDYLWGGNKLKSMFNKESDSDTIAESWELSCHKDGASYIDDGRTLADLLSEHPQYAGEKASAYREFPILIKLIDSKQNLSIQVHPNDEYALINEGQFGKTEMWYIVDCEPGAGVYCGFKSTVDKSTLEAHLNDGTICDILNFIEVKTGDTLFIKAGTVHAICGGIVICEIQQSSSLTYRLYDYGRVGADNKPRELHIAKSLDVIESDITVDVNQTVRTQGVGYKLLADCEYFKAYEISGCYSNDAHNDSFHAITFLSEGELLWTDGKIQINAGQTVFIPAGMGHYSAMCNLMIMTSL